MKFIELTTIKGNVNLINASHIVTVFKVKEGTKVRTVDEYYSICKESVKEIKQKIYSAERFS